MKYSRPLFILFIVSIFFNVNSSYGQLTNLSTDALPPCDSLNDPVYAANLHQTYGGMIDLTDPLHYGWGVCWPPPQNIGDSTLHSFSSSVMATVHVTGGPTFMILAPAQVTVKVKMTGQTGSIRYFDNEMTQLDIGGGNLPAGYLIRVSPLHQSLGQTSIESIGGYYTITSYFDMWTEISQNNGVIWIPADTSGRIELSSSFLSVPNVKNNIYELSLGPNPFSSHCDFSFSVLKSTKAMLNLYDMNGRLIITLFDNPVEPGKKYNVVFNGTDYPNGVYYYAFSAGNKNNYGKIILSK